MTPLLKKPSAWLPIAMSAGALIVLVSFLVIFGVVHEEDEGTAAHLFQLLMGGQVFIIGFFALRWLPQAPKPALQVLALQILAALVPLSLLFFFERM